MRTPTTPPTAPRGGHRSARGCPTVLAALLAVAAASPVQAQDFSANATFYSYDQHCCGYYPLYPGVPARVDLTNGAPYKLASVGQGGAEKTITAVAAGSPFSLEGFLHLTADRNAGDYNQLFTSADLNMDWQNTIHLEHVGQPDGTHAQVRLYFTAMYLAGERSGGGSVLGFGFGFSATQPTSMQSHLLDIVVGAPFTFTANMGFTALAAAGPSKPTGVDTSQAAVFWLLRPVDPGYRFLDSQGNPVPTAPVTMWEGLFPDLPFTPIHEKDDGNYTFRVDVQGGTHYYFDPPASTGYEYEVVSGPRVTGLLLPQFGDGSYRVELWNGSSWVDLGQDVLAGTTLDLTPWTGSVGTARFRVLGIEGEPTDPAVRNFTAGLIFSGSGALELRQTALAVPEPTTVLLWGCGLAAIAARRRCRRPGG